MAGIFLAVDFFAVLFFAADELDYTANQKIRAEPLREAALTRLAAESAVVEGYRYGA